MIEGRGRSLLQPSITSGKKPEPSLSFAGAATFKILNTLGFSPWEIRDSDRVLNCILPLLNYHAALILSACVKVNWI